jgi:hypothetical protein
MTETLRIDQSRTEADGSIGVIFTAMTERRGASGMKETVAATSYANFPAGSNIEQELRQMLVENGVFQSAQ